MFNLVFTEKINHIKDFKWSNRLLIVRVLDFFFYTLSLPPRCKYFDFKPPHSWGFLFIDI